MRRLLFSCAICLGLFAVLQIYALVTSPLTRAVELPKRPRPVASTAPPASSVSTTAAENWLPDEEWIKTAAKCWQRSENSFIYSHTMEFLSQPSGESNDSTQGDAIRMKPFAMIWKDPRNPDEHPLTVVAESARIRFENHFLGENSKDESSIGLTGGDAGRIVSAALEGQVRVTGPNGLVVEGHTFTFNEDNAEIYSDLPIHFRYGPPKDGQQVEVRGTSASGFMVALSPDPGRSMGNDMPSVTQMPKFVRLSGRVVIDLVSDSQRSPSKTRVTSEGPCQFDIAEKILSFRENVLVSRPQGNQGRDEIECYLLALIFGNKAIETETQTPPIQLVKSDEPDQPVTVGASTAGDSSTSMLSQLELKSIRASSNRVTNERGILRSPTQGVECEFNDMQYDAPRRLLTLTDPERVNVWREVRGQMQKFEAPMIEIRHTIDRKLEQLSGIGPGQFIHRIDGQSEGPPDITSHWKDRIDLVPNPQAQWTELTIRGDASVRHLDEMAFSAQILKALMPLLDNIDTIKIASNTVKQPPKKGFDPDQVPVRRIQAIGNVAFFANGVIGRRIDQVDITVDPGQVIPILQGESEAGAGEGNSSPSLLEGEPIVFECARLTGKATFDTSTRKADIRELRGFEGVQLFRSAPNNGGEEIPYDQQAIRVTAREFTAINEGGTRQTLTLRGVINDQGKIREPVVCKFGDFAIEGPRVIIDREKNLITIPGQGVLRFPVDRDFRGNRLSSPVIATVACMEKITFDGQRATFLESVKASLLDNLVKAEQMTAILNKRIDFSADRPDTAGMAIETLECKDRVSVEMYQYDPKRELVEILKAGLHEFSGNTSTGQIRGKGPGKIEDWRRTGTQRMLVQSHGSAKSNRPADSNREYPWEYVVIDFKGPLEGHMQEQWATVKDEAQLLYAPVKNAYLGFKHNDLSGDGENAGDAVWVGSDQMTVVLKSEEGAGKTPKASLFAQGNAEMEGRNFYARAYSLEYEQAQEMFTLKGKGQDKATLNVQRRPGEPFSKLPAQTIRIFPSKQEVSVDGAETFTTTFGGE